MARCPPAAAATTCPAGRPPPPREEEHSQLLPISFQGFRWDYDQDVDTPNRDRLAGEGVKAKYLMPPLVTMTSPSHFTAMPDDRVWIKDWNVASLCPRWKGPQTVVLTTPTAVKVEGIPAWNHHRIQACPRNATRYSPFVAGSQGPQTEGLAEAMAEERGL
nr:uncharacterized protein LOC129395882 isoform X4 [Pan paniscus]